MPTKLKRSEKVRNKQTGKIKTQHYYIKTQPQTLLFDILNKEGTAPKLKQKIRNEFARRGIKIIHKRED